jgi:hypothetical protein
VVPATFIEEAPSVRGAALWLPESEEEIESALFNGLVREGPNFDAKEALPPVGRNKDLARDLCAMTVDGGVLLYGVGGDDPTRPDELRPLPLHGSAERIDQVAQNTIAEPPTIEIRDVPSIKNPGTGYLVVAVPSSPRAPHMVTLEGENRFYGRGATGNRILTEGEIARLYERRTQWEVDREALLGEAMAAMPFESNEIEAAPITLFARPVTGSDDLLERAAAGGPIDELVRGLPQHAREKDVFPDQGNISLGSTHDMKRRGADVWVLGAARDPSSKYQAQLELRMNGTSRFWAVPQARTSNSGALYLLERSVTRHVLQFVEVACHLFVQAGYVGSVDLGIGLTGIQTARGASLFDAFGEGPVYGASDYRRTRRVTMADLKKDATAVISSLLGPLFDVISAPNFDLFEGRR